MSNTSYSYNLIEILNNILKKYTYNDISLKLNVAVGTIKRWNIDTV